MLKIINARIWTGKKSIENGTIVLDGGKIAFVGTDTAITGCEILDAKGGIVSPAFYDAHTHNAMTILRGVGSDLALMDWLGKVMPIEDGLTPEDVYWGVTLACAELLRRGCVGFADHYYFMDEVARAATNCGMRANVSRACSNNQGVDSVIGLHERWHNTFDGRIKVFMGLHAEYTSTPEIAKYAIDTASKLKTGFHVHMSESVSETEGCKERHGCTPVEYFRRLGAFENPTIAAHCVQLTDEDIQILAENNVFAVTNPASNLKLANGIAPVWKMRKAGVHVALGTDGPASNNTLDMVNDMHLMTLLQKGLTADATALPAQDALDIACRQGALAMGFSDCGLLEEGMRADLVVFDSDAENLVPADDIPATLVYAAQGLNVKTTICNGKVLYDNGAFHGIDVAYAAKQVKSAKKRLLNA